MKKLLLVGALGTVALVQSQQPSQAYFRGSWCAKIDSGAGVSQERCDFPTFETCHRYVVGQSRSFCVQNQWRADNWGISDSRSERRFNMIYR